MDVYGSLPDANGETVEDKVKFNPQGFVYTVAGSGVAGFSDGNSINASFNGPQDIAVDGDRNIYVADTKNHCIRRITAQGVVSTVAGRCGPKNKGFKDGAAGPDCVAAVCYRDPAACSHCAT